MNVKTGKFKGLLERNLVINLRISQDELSTLDALCAQMKADGSKHCSRTDVIVLALKYSSGQITLLDRMELNLLDNKSMFDTAHYPKEKYGDLLKKVY